MARESERTDLLQPPNEVWGSITASMYKVGAHCWRSTRRRRNKAPCTVPCRNCWRPVPWAAWGVCGWADTIVNAIAIELLHFKISRGEAITPAHVVLRCGWGQDWEILVTSEYDNLTIDLGILGRQHFTRF